MQENKFETKVCKVSFIIETKNPKKGKESAKDKLKNIMVKDSIDK